MPVKIYFESDENSLVLDEDEDDYGEIEEILQSIQDTNGIPSILYNCEGIRLAKEFGYWELYQYAYNDKALFCQLTECMEYFKLESITRLYTWIGLQQKRLRDEMNERSNDWARKQWVDILNHLYTK